MSESFPGGLTPRWDAGEVDSESRREGGQSLSLSLGAKVERWSLPDTKWLIETLSLSVATQRLRVA